MKWVRYRILTTPEAEDIIISEMSELGLAGAQIEDNVPLTAAEKEQIYTYDADDPVDDGIACVSFYAELNTDGTVTVFDDTFFAEETSEQVLPDVLRMRMEHTLLAIRQHMDIGEGTLDVSVMDDAEWKDNWKQFFHRFYIDDILVTPSWEAEDLSHTDNGCDARYVLRIDPGTAFGTGAHETTQIAIRLLRKQTENAHDKPAGMRVLDIGTGSGILGILALMFGAAHVTGVDVDAFTKEAVRQNLEANDVDASGFTLLTGNLLEDETFCETVEKSAGEDPETGYDIAIANILPVVLKPLTPLVPRFLAKNGVYIVSGILCEKEDEMKQVLSENGFVVFETMRRGEWCGMAARLSG